MTVGTLISSAPALPPDPVRHTDTVVLTLQHASSATGGTSLFGFQHFAFSVKLFKVSVIGCSMCVLILWIFN